MPNEKDNESKLTIPREELLYILPDARKKLFLNMIENFKLYCPDVTIIYAALNYDSSIGVDFCIVGEVNTPSGDIAVWCTPFQYTEFTTPGYRYVVKNNLHAQFFKELRSQFAQATSSKFKEYIKSSHCGLNFIKGKPNFWKDPKNAKILIKSLSEIYLQYVPAGGFRSTKGFGSHLSSVNGIPSLGAVFMQEFNPQINKS